LKLGSKSDAIDALKLAELLRAGMLSPVYHGERSALEVQQLARSYTMLTEDTTRVMNRLKAVFRGQAVGGAIPVDASILIEFAPARIRGYSGGVLPVAFPLGNLAASLLALLIIPRFGWRALFLVGVLPALLTVWVRRTSSYARAVLAFVVAAFPDLLLPPSEFIAAALRGLKVAEKSDQNNNGDRNP
jgi:hypothetical protein